jgi:branched-chain amino acid transport system permease protein
MVETFHNIVNLLFSGLAIASSLFIVSSGLSIIFGISRVYNFAHGSLYMLGAYITYSLMTRLPQGLSWFLLSIVLAAGAVGAIGLCIEVSVLRRIYKAPHHLQIIATFGAFLIIRDAVSMVWGPVELVAPGVPGLTGAFTAFGVALPSYYILLFVVVLLVFAALILIFHRTRWGVLLRAAIQDRDMVSALGVNQKILFTSVFALSAALAGLAGGVDLVRVSADLDMDITLIVDAFAVVVIGGMGSIVGSLVASILVGVLESVGTVYFPQMSLALVFVTMAVILLIRPFGLFGKKIEVAPEGEVTDETILRPASREERWLSLAALGLLMVAPAVLTPYWIDTFTEVFIYILFASAFYFLAGPGGMVSLGQAAYFGIGIYAPALLFKYYNITMTEALFIAPLAAGAAAAVIGSVSVRLVGIYFGMLTLAFAQILWSVIYQWMDVTGGELGIIGLWPDDWANERHVYYYLVLAIMCLGVFVMRWLVFAPFGYAFRAGRDSMKRADAIGINVRRHKLYGFVVAGAFSGMAGVLMLYHNGGAYPTDMDLQISLDVFVMALLGGLQSLNGPIIGATIYRLLKIVLQTNFDHWNMLVGIMLILLALFLPRGLGGLFGDLRNWRARRRMRPSSAPFVITGAAIEE